jgi:glutamine synthetase
MTLEELRESAGNGSIDTVLLAIVDMQGRLQGKRLTTEHFLDEVVEHNAEGCNYLLAVDVDMDTVEGYAMSSWDKGYGDFVMRPDLDTLRPVPWLPGTAMCLADLEWADGSEVVASPRQILRRQIARLAERGWVAAAGTELEFQVFNDTYEDAWRRRYAGLEPANLYNVDYSPVLDTADQHAIYTNGAKEIAAQEGRAITFMAKFDEREGNSCHIHLSLQGGDGTALFDAQPDLFDAFLAGLLAGMRELTLLFAPNVNSYKRFAAGSFAPTAVAWGSDNRTCSLRVVGHGASRRVENRLPGADVNPYLALSAMIAAGLHGIDAGLELEPPLEGNAYESDAPRVPDSLRDARDLFAESALAREAFGEEVVHHYLNNARVELDAFGRAVTDWERIRGFERL